MAATFGSRGNPGHSLFMLVFILCCSLSLTLNIYGHAWPELVRGNAGLFVIALIQAPHKAGISLRELHEVEFLPCMLAAIAGDREVARTRLRYDNKRLNHYPSLFSLHGHLADSFPFVDSAPARLPGDATGFR